MVATPARSSNERSFTLSLSQITGVREDIGEIVIALQQLCRLLDALDSAAPIIPNELAAMLRPYLRALSDTMGELDAWQEVQP